MTRFILTPAAQNDLSDIWDYTAQQWNVDQAERYIRDIEAACKGLAVNTRISRPVDIREGYQKSPVGSHMLYFKTDDAGTLTIVRILHQRMDTNKNL